MPVLPVELYSALTSVQPIEGGYANLHSVLDVISNEYPGLGSADARNLIEIHIGQGHISRIRSRNGKIWLRIAHNTPALFSEEQSKVLYALMKFMSTTTPALIPYAQIKENLNLTDKQYYQLRKTFSKTLVEQGIIEKVGRVTYLLVNAKFPVIIHNDNDHSKCRQEIMTAGKEKALQLTVTNETLQFLQNEIEKREKFQQKQKIVLVIKEGLDLIPDLFENPETVRMHFEKKYSDHEATKVAQELRILKMLLDFHTEEK